jgi:hypothetical protein
MAHQDENEQRHSGLETPQHVWQSMHREEEPEMEMRLTTDQLCAKARYHERENVWFQWFVVVVCLSFGAMCVYEAVIVEQIWVRLGFAWMVVLLALGVGGAIRVGARRIQAGESCAQFMVRELEGGRRTLLALRWGFLLVMPSLLMLVWGGTAAIRARNLNIDPALRRHLLLISLWPMVAILLVLLAVGVFLGREAKKKANQAEELRRAIEGRE